MSFVERVTPVVDHPGARESEVCRGPNCWRSDTLVQLALSVRPISGMAAFSNLSYGRAFAKAYFAP
jgi:hypothetical protein